MADIIAEHRVFVGHMSQTFDDTDFTRNCNLLTGLLSTPDPFEYASQIARYLTYICSIRMGADSNFVNKSCATELYHIRFMSETLVHFYKHWDDSWMAMLPTDLTRYKTPWILIQALIQVLDSQNEDGSWGRSPSSVATAYALVALSNFLSVPFAHGLSDQIIVAIDKGHLFLNKDRDHTTAIPPSGKTIYTATHTSKEDFLSTIQTKYPNHTLATSLNTLFDGFDTKSTIYAHMVKSIPQTEALPSWKIDAIVLEGCIFASHLHTTLPDLFGRRNLKGMHHDDRYFDLVPILIMCVNSLSGLKLRADVMHEITSLTIYHFEYDDFVEHVLQDASEEFCRDLEGMLDNVFRKNQLPTPDDSDDELEEVDNNGCKFDNLSFGVTSTISSSALSKLQEYINYHLHHPAVLDSPASPKAQLKIDLKEFIQHGIHQNHLSKSFYSPSSNDSRIIDTSFYKWLHTTSIINSGAFAYCTMLQALIAKQDEPTISKSDAVTTYLLQELRTHIALKGRFTNDRVSIFRDREEGNLNCVDFPEFGFPRDAIRDAERVKQIQKYFLELEKYEMEVCEGLFKELEKRGRKGAEVKALRFTYILEQVHGAFYELKSHKRPA